ncbi:MAG: HAD family phosphatase [Endomicrobium sp.]|nr:HAD family phosphatase [Endomicrobium sp.]
MSSNKCYKAVFFDMDGVVVDSMPYHFISWFEVLRQYDVCIVPSLIFEMEGAKWDEVIKLALKQSGMSLQSEIMNKVVHEKEKIFKKYFKRFIFTGVSEFIKSLKNQGILVGLVTGSGSMEAKCILPGELYNLFDTVVAVDMVKKAKPNPESYLTAAKNLNVLPEDCMVVENAPYGVKAAKAAKMFCCAVATSLSRENLVEADEIFSNHQELFNYFEQLEY